MDKGFDDLPLAIRQYLNENGINSGFYPDGQMYTYLAAHAHKNGEASTLELLRRQRKFQLDQGITL